MAAMLSMVHDSGKTIGSEISAEKIGEKGIGALVCLKSAYKGGGNVPLSDLTAALVAEGSGAMPPEAPSGVVRTARAAEAVAKAHSYSCVSRRKVQGAKRGTDGWELVRGSHVDHSDPSGTLGARVSPIVATAREGSFDGDASIVGELRTAYLAAADILTGADLSTWFTSKVTGLGGMTFKEGTYYLASEKIGSFKRMRNAIQKATSGRYEVHMAALANTEEGLDVVLSSIIHDTGASVDDVQKTIEGGGGKRALTTCETKCRALLARLERFAGLLGPKLDAIKASVEEAEKGVAVAMLAACSEEDEKEGNK